MSMKKALAILFVAAFVLAIFSACGVPQQASDAIQAHLDEIWRQESLNSELPQRERNKVTAIEEVELPGVYEATGLQLLRATIEGDWSRTSSFLWNGYNVVGGMGVPVEIRIVEYNGDLALAYRYITHTGIGWHGLRVVQVIDGQVQLVHHVVRPGEEGDMNPAFWQNGSPVEFDVRTDFW